MSTALLFPGQGSQKAGMGKALAERFAAARQVFEEADEALGFSISTICFEGPADKLTLTEITQPAILTQSIAVLRALDAEKGISYSVTMGHSLGEYTALVAAGALTLADAVRLVHLRGKAMQEAVPVGRGGMAAIMGLSPYAVQALCDEVSGSEVCAPANFNGGEQVVISGHIEAIDRAVAVYGRLGNFRQSIASLTDAIRLAPRNPDSYFNRGTTYFQLGDYEKAIQDFSNVIRLSPRDDSACYWRGVSQEAAGHQQDAIADYRQFLELSGNPDARAEIEFKLNQWNERQESGGRAGTVAKNRQKTNRVQPQEADQKLDLHALITALGERALSSTWMGSDVDCRGEKAEELYASTGERLWISLGGTAARFTAEVGVDDAAGGGSICFRFLGDGGTLFDSGIMKTNQKAKPVEVNLKGIKNLLLLVTDAGDGIAFDHANWAQAKIEMISGAPKAISPHDDEKVILTPQPGPEPRINGPKVYGCRPGNPFLYRVPTQGQRPIKFTAKNLPKTLSLNPATGFIDGIAPEAGEYLVILRAKNKYGTVERELRIVSGDKLALTPPMGWNDW